MSAARNHTAHNCIDNNSVGDSYVGHNYKGDNYTGLQVRVLLEPVHERAKPRRIEHARLADLAAEWVAGEVEPLEGRRLL